MTMKISKGDAQFEGRVPKRSWLLLLLLAMAYFLSIADRMILALLIEPIKKDLQLSDTQIGLIQGLAFVLLYSTTSIPLGRLADRVSRTSLLAVGIAVWSFSTSACGLASQAWHLFIGRIGVGLGEASLMPASYSLIPDTFPRKRLGMATGLFALGGTLGMGASLFIGGKIYDRLSFHGSLDIAMVGILAPWQQTFIVVGLPGLAVAAILWLFPEPKRMGETSAAPPAWKEVGAFVGRNWRWVSPFFLAVALSAGMSFVSATWVVSYLVRSHGLDIVEASRWTGLVHMAASAFGTVVIGSFSDTFSKSGGYRRLYLCSLVLVICAVCGFAYPIASTVKISIILWGVTIACTVVPTAAAAANLQEYVPGRIRGVISGAFLLVVNLVGFVGGTMLVAVVSDQFFPEPDGLRYALVWVGTPVALISALLYIIAGSQQRQCAQAGMFGDEQRQ